jgi:hypothetical protein
LIKADVLYRAVPWVRWSLERRRLGAELNAGPLQKVALVITVLLVASGLAAMASGAARVSFVGLAGMALAINLPLFRLFWRRGGASLFVAGFLLQQVYYCCALAGLLLGIACYYWPGRRPVSAPAARVGA